MIQLFFVHCFWCLVFFSQRVGCILQYYMYATRACFTFSSFSQICFHRVQLGLVLSSPTLWFSNRGQWMMRCRSTSSGKMLNPMRDRSGGKSAGREKGRHPVTTALPRMPPKEGRTPPQQLRSWVLGSKTWWINNKSGFKQLPVLLRIDILRVISCTMFR